MKVLLLLFLLATVLHGGRAQDCEGMWTVNTCSATCGGGQGAEMYQVTLDAGPGGKPCEAVDGETRTLVCNTQLCGQGKVDCVGQWTTMSNCSASCNGGTKADIFTISQDPSEYPPGEPCEAGDGDTKTTFCNTFSCEKSTCDTVPVEDCLAKGEIQVEDPASTLCDKTKCATDCCRPVQFNKEDVSDDQISQLYDPNSAAGVTTTTVYVSGSAIVMLINVHFPPAPLSLDGTEFFVGQFGNGIESTFIAMLTLDEASRLEGVQLPTNRKFTVIVKIERYNKNHQLVHAVPIEFYLCTNDTADLQVYIIQNGKLVDLRVYESNGVKGSITAVAQLLPSCRYWFKVLSPTTSTFVGAQMAPQWCDTFQCTAGTPYADPNSILCDHGLCTPDQCCDATCGTYSCNVGTPKTTVNDIVCNGFCDDAQCCDEPGPYCGDSKVNWHIGEQCEPPNVGCCDGHCHFKAKGTLCRRKVRTCERQAVCTGFSGKCPKKIVLPDGTPCDAGFVHPTLDKYFCLHGHCRKSRWCGNGKVERNEDCEPPNTECCDGSCRFKPTSIICRGAEGPCDVADFCSGRHGDCGLDFKKPNGATCFNKTTMAVGICLHGECNDLEDSHHSHGSGSSSSSYSHGH